jgi:hypothetical protein
MILHLQILNCLMLYIYNSYYDILLLSYIVDNSSTVIIEDMN